ncbi:hypothetical protein KAZ01_03340 [Candidatus Gracilibacteria bacterium]|nr:hypothetical protein [Candidatus Gracilibacteria bacterium]
MSHKGKDSNKGGRKPKKPDSHRKQNQGGQKNQKSGSGNTGGQRNG